MPYILVAEDDKFLANAYRVKLQKEGFEVSIASNGNEVLDSLSKKIPDLIVLDLVMPIMDGFDTLEAIKKNDKFKKIKIIIASNLNQKEDIDRGLALGADNYIVKSDISIDDLVKKIRSMLR